MVTDAANTAVAAHAPAVDVDRPVDAGSAAVRTADLVQEQQFVGRLYGRLDEMRAETEQLRNVYRQGTDNTPGGRVQRDIGYAHHSATLTSLNVAEDRLCFGRLDIVQPDPETRVPGGVTQHIGRLGMFESGADGRQLLMDWRAPSARPFYVATAVDPLGVVRRRHLRIRRRRVEGLSDEYLDVRPDALALVGLDAVPRGEADGPAGESALLEALNAPRTGRMTDIVATIQAEQDRIIRSDRAGVLVVQGGPGTGKTAVALHRVAYLLYTFRETLAGRGVLVIGPNATFLSYIGQVLPSLGENAVVLRTVGDLFPGVSATAVDRPEIAVVKGRLSMAPVVANAVLDRQRVPVRATVIASGQGRLVVEPSLWRAAQRRAWGSRLPHNRARTVLVRTVVNGLARQVAARHRSGLAADIDFTEEDFAEVRAELRADDAVRAALAGVWPALTAQQLLAEVFAQPRRLAAAAPGLTPRQRELLQRNIDSPWTVSDVPLLDEAGELLGPLPTTDPASVDQADGSLREYAQDVLDMMATEHPDAEAPTGPRGQRAGGGLAATDLSALQEDRAALTSVAERAAADREWTYGHVVVDEAQELSPMAWRVVLRRCPIRSMTVVGDIAQTSDPSGATSWAAALRPHVHDAFRVSELTVNYRTPREISDIADRVLARIDPELRPPEAVRSTGVPPWWRRVGADEVADAAASAARQELADLTEGQVAVLTPQALFADIDRAVRREFGDGPGADRVVVSTVGRAKGLEFDTVLLIEPDLIESESARGKADVYVALTRATQRLGVLYSGRTPAAAR